MLPNATCLTCAAIMLLSEAYGLKLDMSCHDYKVEGRHLRDRGRGHGSGARPVRGGDRHRGLRRVRTRRRAAAERAWFFSAEEPPPRPTACSACPSRSWGGKEKVGGLSLIQISGDVDARTLACDLPSHRCACRARPSIPRLYRAGRNRSTSISRTTPTARNPHGALPASTPGVRKEP